MKEESIIKAFCEINGKFNHAWIRGIYSLDKYTILLELYSKGLTTFLIASIKKNDPRFHLLFVRKIPKELCINIPFQLLLNRYIKGAQIECIKYKYPYILIKIKSTAYYSLFIDFHALNIIFLNEKGSPISSIHPKKDKEENLIMIDNIAFDDASKFKENCMNYIYNRALSDDFIHKKSEDIKKRIIKAVKRELKKNQKLLEKLDKEKLEAENKEYYKKTGELLKYNLSNLKRRMRSVKLKDFYGNEVEIKLNPELSPRENMEYFFRKYKKLQLKEKPLLARINDIKKEIKKLTTLIENIEALNTPLFPKKTDEILKEIGTDNKKFIRLIYGSLIDKKTHQKSKANSPREPFLKLYTSSGKLMLIGKSALENEQLIKKFSRGNDLWFHAEEVEGSHVILRYGKKDDNFTEKDIEEAALIAAYYSKLRKYGEGNIVYTRCKYLSKPKESKPGFFIYHNNKTFFVRIDESKVKAIQEESARQS